MENKFGETLKYLRNERKKGIINIWENGLREPTMPSLISLSKYFDVTVDYLVGLEK